MKILLVGGTGQLGGDLLRNNVEHEIHAPARSVLDLRSPEAIASTIVDGGYTVVVNAAAFHDVPRCELEPEEAFRVNCVAVRDLAEACRRTGALLVTFSSDYVFGGEKRTPYLEDDRPAPLQIYGMTRLAGEQAALAGVPDRSLVIRTCGLFGRSGARSKGGNFVDKRVQDGLAGAPCDMGNDQTMSPTSTDDLSRAVLRLIGRGRPEPGIYHLVNEGACTWYELARAVYDLMGFRSSLTPVDRGGRTGAMRRPLNSALANTRAARLGITLPPWRDALMRYLDLKYGLPSS